MEIVNNGGPTTPLAAVRTRKKTTRYSPPGVKSPKSSKQKIVNVNVPSGICPKCSVYVKDGDDGVVCNKCCILALQLC